LGFAKHFLEEINTFIQQVKTFILFQINAVELSIYQNGPEKKNHCFTEILSSTTVLTLIIIRNVP